MKQRHCKPALEGNPEFLTPQKYFHVKWEPAESLVYPQHQHNSWNNTDAEGLLTDQWLNERKKGGPLSRLPRSSPSEAGLMEQEQRWQPGAQDPMTPAKVVHLACSVFISKICQHLESRIQEQIWFLAFSQESETLAARYLSARQNWGKHVPLPPPTHPH